MIVDAFLLLHILGGSLAIAAGYAAPFARKGGPAHRRAGMLFVYAMLALESAPQSPVWPAMTPRGSADCSWRTS